MRELGLPFHDCVYTEQGGAAPESSGSEVHCSVRQTSKICQDGKSSQCRENSPSELEQKVWGDKGMHGRGESAVFLNSERRCRRGHVPKGT